MHNSVRLFNQNIAEVWNLAAVYDYMSGAIAIPHSFDDLLRSQIVYGVSAFDKLIHDLIRIGMVETFIGTRQATAKYLNEVIPMQVHVDIVAATLPPKEFIFEQAVIRKLSYVSYQDSGKVADGLSYIWGETNKWQKISVAMTSTEDAVKTTLKLVVDRRNAIAHQADIDPSTNQKYPISRSESMNAVNFLHSCGNAIATLVI
jgi:RiboL-PSP-HEPN